MEDKCKYCGGEGIFEETLNSIHYGKLKCKDCGKWIKWIKNPEKQGRTKTSKYDLKRIKEHYKFDKEFCFFCLRERDQLGWDETLTRDHIQELDKGGKDELENIQILCTACHKLKNWMRLYNNWHKK